MFIRRYAVRSVALLSTLLTGFKHTFIELDLAAFVGRAWECGKQTTLAMLGRYL
jgi:hypothetical protein